MPPDTDTSRTTGHNVYRDGRVHVMAERCATCIFRPGNLMRLDRGRVADMAATAVQRESVIVCHATLNSDANAACRGYWDGYRWRVQALQLAERLNAVAWQGTL